MALSLVGQAEGVGALSTDLTITLPGGTTTDDVVYLGVATGIVSDPTFAMTTAGYTKLCDLSNVNTGTYANLAVFRKIMGATPDTTAVVTAVSLGYLVGVVHVWRGADLATPEDATTTTAVAGSKNPDSPSITTVTANAIVLSFGAAGTDDTAVTAPTNYNNQGDINQTLQTVAVASRLIVSAGAENPAAWTDFSGPARPSMAAATVAIRPAAATTKTSTGVLNSGASTLAGVAEREIKSTGALAAAVATLAGVAEREVTAIGALASAAAAVAGTAERTVTASGALAAQSAAVAGVAEREVTASGALVAQASTVAGAGAVAGTTKTSTGVLLAGASSVAGVAVVASLAVPSTAATGAPFDTRILPRRIAVAVTLPSLAGDGHATVRPLLVARAVAAAVLPTLVGAGAAEVAAFATGVGTLPRLSIAADGRHFETWAHSVLTEAEIVLLLDAA